VSTTVHLSDELATRIGRIAAKRRVSPDKVVADMLTAQLPREEALDAFIGSGSSGRGDLAQRHRDIRVEMTKDLGASDL
jgi:predicted transcriptional regulator